MALTELLIANAETLTNQLGETIEYRPLGGTARDVLAIVWRNEADTESEVSSGSQFVGATVFVPRSTIPTPKHGDRFGIELEVGRGVQSCRVDRIDASRRGGWTFEVMG